MMGVKTKGKIHRREGVTMGIELNHTIVRVRDKRESAQFLAEILGLGAPTAFGPFLAVQTGNDVSWTSPTTTARSARSTMRSWFAQVMIDAEHRFGREHRAEGRVPARGHSSGHDRTASR